MQFDDRIAYRALIRDYPNRWQADLTRQNCRLDIIGIYSPQFKLWTINVVEL